MTFPEAIAAVLDGKTVCRRRTISKERIRLFLSEARELKCFGEQWLQTHVTLLRQDLAATDWEVCEKEATP